MSFLLALRSQIYNFDARHVVITVKPDVLSANVPILIVSLLKLAINSNLEVAKRFYFPVRNVNSSFSKK